MIRRLAVVSLAFAALAVTSCNDTTPAEPTERPLAAPINGGRVFTSLALGDFHSCGLTADGEAFCWGLNSQGQAGNGVDAGDGVATPLVVLGGFQFSSLTAGGSHTCGIATNGASFCWGNNAGGQLGTGNNIERGEPTAVAGDHPFIQLTASTASHTCGLEADGEAWCWGVNENGRLGDGTEDNRTSPVRVSGGLSFTSLAAGGGHTCGLTANGTAYCWGLNSRGQVGDGTNTQRLAPALVSTTVKFKQLAAGVAHTCGVALDGLAYCWGDNVVGALGDETTESKSSPVPVAGGNQFTSIVIGERHGCGLTQEGITLCWGFNNFGALGDGTFITRLSPVAMFTPIVFKKLAAGAYHTCGINLSDVTYCWGENSALQLGSTS